MADANYPSSRDAQRDSSALKDDNDLDPAAFLKSVRELSEKREREDAERFRKLEEEVQKGREERAARRAERARSISPEKQHSTTSTPANRNLSRTTTNASLLSSPPVTLTPTISSKSTETPSRTPKMEPEKTPVAEPEKVPEFKGFGSIKRSSTSSSRASSQAGAESSNTTSQSASNLARSGTLSWQQRPRPGSKLGGPRPLSMASVDSAAAHSRKPSADEPEPTRDQIAASLGARDPTWFRQTADRGVGNAAYRKSKEESAHGGSPFTGRRGLPGMSREASVEVERPNESPTSGSGQSETVSRGGSIRESTVSNNSSRYSATSTSSNKPDLKSLIAADEDQQRASPSFDQTSIASGDSGSIARTLTMSSSQARLSGVDRPASPTKGMGGFVQSAMMKRSDSQNKRWSAQPVTGLSRQGSAASMRGGFGGLQGSHSMPKLEPKPSPKEAIQDASARPPSSSNNDLASLVTATEQDPDGFVKPALPHHNRSKSVASNHSAHDDSGVPGSPSKRWSPNKSSWIESSLTRPESPKLAPSKNAQPSWMADLAKAKAQRASQDSSSFSGITKPGEDDGSKPPSRPGSPTKSTPFGPALLKRSESRAEPSTGDTPLGRSDDLGSRPGSPLKGAPFGRDSLKSPEPRDPPKTPQSATPKNVLKPLRLADKFTSSPAATSPSTVSKANETPLKGSESVQTESKDAAFEESCQPSTSQPETSKVSSTADVEKVETSKLPTNSTPQETRSTAKSVPDTPPKPTTDFRSQLKSRPRAETKSNEEPEFLSKFGNLRKAQQEKYVAPDVLKNNILRGKSGLAVTGGPVKTERKDLLKESLLAKKDDWKEAKLTGRELPGQAHERKISATTIPQAPSKPEALAKRDLLGRSDSTKFIQQTERAREATPEALARHKSLKQKPVVDPPAKDSATSSVTEAKFPSLHKQVSAPSAIETAPAKETSRLAARFNPGLAGMLARGPPSSTPSRSESPATPGQGPIQSLQSASSEVQATDTPLQDVRKDRAKGPKRRKGGAKTVEVQAGEPSSGATFDAKPEEQSKDITSGVVSVQPKPNLSTESYSQSQDAGVSRVQQVTPKPQALPGSAAALMRASLNKTSQPETSQNPSTPNKLPLTHDGAADVRKPAPFAKSPSLTASGSSVADKASSTPSTAQVPEFKGFGSARNSRTLLPSDDNKENSGEISPSVKSAASQWGRRPSPQKSGGPSQIQLPTKKDEEAAMRSAGLLASSSSRPQNGLSVSIDKRSERSTSPASAGLPPKPAKSSRTVSGQLAEASSPRGFTPSPVEALPKSEAGRLLLSAFGSLPKHTSPLAIDTADVLANSSVDDEPQVIKTVRKLMEVVTTDGTLKALPPQEEYTFFDESAYLCTHVYTDNGVKHTHLFIWDGDGASETCIEAANSNAKRIVKEMGHGSIETIHQGHESSCFLQAAGGIFITRRGAIDSAPKQYMLCGRKHLGHIVFDEVDFAIDSLCAGFAFLVSYPVTLRETRLYLWKGQACSAEELSAARLAAMDISETGEIIEVDSGAEFNSFIKIFGANFTKANVTKPSALWQQKATCAGKFKARLYRIQQAEIKTGLLTSLWNRRPSWNRLSPARSPVPEDDVKVEAKELSPFSQAQLDAEGIYVLDAYSELYILIGPLLASQPQTIRDALLGQTLLFASDYAILSASMEDRPVTPKCVVVWSGVPRDVKVLFRHWDDSRGLWGTAGLMAGSLSTLGASGGVKLIPVEEMLGEVCRD